LPGLPAAPRTGGQRGAFGDADVAAGAKGFRVSAATKAKLRAAWKKRRAVGQQE
jgi:hypothetical protein